MRNAGVSLFIVFLLSMTMFTPLIAALPTDTTGGGPRTTPNHNPIGITGDADFDAAHGVVAGKGTSSEPFIIENWTISGLTNNAIRIRDTRAYFIIRNCTLYDGSSIGATGVLLYNVSNGTVQDNLFWNNENSIYAEFLNDTVIMNNTIHDDTFSGIDLITGQNNTIANNLIYNEELYGLWIEDAQDDEVFGNIIYNCSLDGLIYFSSFNETFNDNILYNNSESGLYSRLYNSTIHNNSIYGNGLYGILDGGSKNCTFSNNSIHDHSEYGLQLFSAHWGIGNTIIGNEFYANPTGLGIIGQDGIKILGNSFHNNTIAGLTILDCINVILEDNSVTGNTRGLNLSSDGKTLSNVMIKNNTIVSNTDGIVIYDYLGVTLSKNTFLSNKYGLGIDASGHEGYKLNIDSSNTIDGKPIVYLVDASGGAVPYQPGFLGLVGCDNITVEGQYLRNNRQGILVAYSENITLKDNFVNSSRIGIDIVSTSRSIIEGNNLSHSEVGLRLLTQNNYGSEGNFIQDNDVHDCMMGLELTGPLYFIAGKKGTTVRNNLVHNNLKGIVLVGTNFQTVYKNEIRDNSEEGILIEQTYGNLIDNNTIVGNGMGINFSQGWQDTISGNFVINNTGCGLFVNSTVINYVNNNMFSNSENFQGDYYSQIKWTVPKTSGPNIMGGPFLGGNYWSDYTGTDTDHDYIGDTDLPYRSGDKMPLLGGPANMTDLTKGIPMEARSFALNMSCAYKFGVQSANVSYSFDDGPWTSINMTKILGDEKKAYFQTYIDIPRKATFLHYVLGSMTMLGGWGTLPQKDLWTMDIDKPSIVDLSGIPTTGDLYNLTFNISDKGILAGASVTYNFDGSAPVTKDILATSGMATFTLQVPPSARKLYYNGTCWDRSFNNASISGERDVLDNDPPVFALLNGTPQTGQAYDLKVNATENRGMGEVFVAYNFGQGNTSAKMILDGGLYTIRIQVPLNATVLHVFLKGNDTIGNAGTAASERIVEDIVLPLIVDMSGKPTTGDSFNIKANFTDNIMIDLCTVEYRFDNGTSHTLTFDGILNATVPSSAKILWYSLICEDNSGNKANVTKRAEVSDNDAPFVNDLTLLSTKYGNKFSFRSKVTDNIGVTKVYAEYWVGNTKHTTLLIRSGDEYVWTIPTPADVAKFKYVIVAQDASGNVARSPEKTVKIEQPQTILGMNVALLALLIIVIIAIVVILVLMLRHRMKKAKPDVDEEVPDKDRDGIRALDKSEEE